MKLPKPRVELVDEIRFALERGPKPAYMGAWDRGWLEQQDDRELIRCWLETAEMRLNPTNSTDFSEPGISPGERRARIIEFVCSVDPSRHGQLAIEALEKVFLIVEMAECREESADGWSEISRGVLGAWQKERTEAREQRARGGKRERPTDAAKDLARDLWATKGVRLGWSAATLHTALARAGHEVAFTTVQKWLPKLRKGTL